MKYAIALAAIVLSSPVLAQVEQPSLAATAQASQPQPADHTALAARKRARLETMIMPSGKRSDCDPAGCTRYELKAPSPAR